MFNLLLVYFNDFLKKKIMIKLMVRDVTVMAWNEKNVLEMTNSWQL